MKLPQLRGPDWKTGLYSALLIYWAMLLLGTFSLLN